MKTRLKLLIIALSLSLVSTILGLSAYLTDVETLQRSIKTIGQKNLGFTVEAREFQEEVVTPGDNFSFNLNVKNGSYCPIYVFVRLNIDSDLDSSSGLQEGWSKLNGYNNVYYYGTDNRLREMDKNGEALVFSHLKLKPEAPSNKNYLIDVIGYAIQTTGINESTDPAYVYGLAGGNTVGTTSSIPPIMKQLFIDKKLFVDKKLFAYDKLANL